MGKLRTQVASKLKLQRIEETHTLGELNQGHLRHIVEQIAQLERKNEKSLEAMKISIGRNESRLLAHIGSTDINANEFQVFSQWGEDGILQFLLRKVPVKSARFIEFGVEDYVESNTRFLLMNNNWSGLVFDGDKENIEKIVNNDLYWRYDLTAKQAFITKENINTLIVDAGFGGDIGILSIDIDGNDFWVWEAIDSIDPSIVVIEYNHRFGDTEKLTVPYDPKFVRGKAHFSMVYAGASLALLAALGDKKGYDLVGTASNGNNAFFVKKNLRPKDIKKMTSQEAFHQGKFREARDERGMLSYITAAEESKILKSLPTVNPLSQLQKKRK